MKISVCLFSVVLASVCCHAQSKEYTINVGDFNELKVTSAINVDYVCSADSAGLIRFTSKPDMASSIEAQVKKGRLRISVKDENGGTSGGQLPTVTVYSGSLHKVENEGDSTVRVLSPVAVPNFSARLIGNGALVVRGVKATTVDCSLLAGHGRMVVYGECTDARFNLTGTGIMQADGLKAVNASCFATGTGEIGVNADKIKVSGAGSAIVYYVGSPVITKSFAIGVKILPLEEK